MKKIISIKEDNEFIKFDLTTKYNYFTQDVIKQIISQIKNHQSLVNYSITSKFCSIDNKRLMCLFSKPEFVDKIPKIKISFNGLPNFLIFPQTLNIQTMNKNVFQVYSNIANTRFQETNSLSWYIALIQIKWSYF
ncbi:unnamed protein product (macronuclear) [Paramecium tetraurelia]|uniref:Uncharacterized protein n=1 Tax=Paramecium tetraurelia TaxID=5888 RepID=A0DQ99_PARTE|nr:uncharacterized protein GSPATT00002616001 [Paramecium tetraurelia]CAK85216.1 unnamed protein product [Paramecium tetraurelia]|eukprot:XP_001452613.1 hypothetical protein (macronuclear) [Paramecium tetraurelia strain d4-2]